MKDKEAKRLYDIAYRAKNKVKRKKQQRKWAEENREHEAEKLRRFYESHKDEMKDRACQWYQDNKEAKQKYDKAYAANHDAERYTARKRHKVKKLFGLTLEEYNLLRSQATHCPLCGIELIDDIRSSAPDSKVLDHCHSTGKVRGFTCRLCNLGLGMFLDNAAAMEKAAAWIKEQT